MKKFLLILFISLSTVVGFAESKNALLIANSTYSNFGTLVTPISEARQLKNALSQIGFNVTILEDANRVQMQDAIDDFSVKVKSVGGIGLFHYGGHAVQVNGKNYLIPIDANIPSQNKVASRSIDVDDVMASMNADSNIVILDSCRDNPLPAESRSSGTRGLALTDVKTKNSIIVYSADSGNTAQDGVFTPSLIKHITDKKEFTQILREVRNEVRTKTNGKQNPSSYDQLSNDIYLAGMPSVNQTSIASNQSNEEIERLKRELEKLKNNSSKTTTSTGSESGKTPSKNTILAGYEMVKIPSKNYEAGKNEVTQKLYKEIMGENPSYFKGDDLPVESVSWYDVIYFCNKLSERCGYAPVYSVNGTTDVTKWKYSPHNRDSIKGNISQNINANGFRLPTEEEWEYVAKSGENYTYSGSNNLDEVGWYDDNSGDKTHPVGQKKANGYGLYDMSGNVWEWCWDSSGGYRYLRGGSYYYTADYCAVSYRYYYCANIRDNYLGFRLIRTSK